MSDILVIKCKIKLPEKRYEELYRLFTEQMNNECVVLPYYCDAVVIPDGVNVMLDQEDVIKAEEI